jgi:hypothetical protein
MKCYNPIATQTCHAKQIKIAIETRVVPKNSKETYW